MKELNFKALGVKWMAKSDELVVSVSPPAEKLSKRWTKVGILTFSHQVFDPIGVLIPIMVRAKLVLQKCWQEKVD